MSDTDNKSPVESVLALEIQELPYDFATIFGNDHPVELEVGIGKGRFLMQAAKQRPNCNFVGIEWASKFYRLVLDRAERKSLTNLRLLRDDAGHTFSQALADDCLAGVYVYFPDPWPKKRHNKRRLVQAAWLDHATRVIRDGGFLKLATDHIDYFEQMDRETKAHPMLHIEQVLVGEDARVGITNYETKYREEGRRIHNIDCQVVKKVSI